MDQIPNTHEWTNLEAVFSKQSVRQLDDATTEELLEVVFSMRFVTRYYKQEKCRI
jgi:hypothetical protein